MAVVGGEGWESSFLQPRAAYLFPLSLCPNLRREGTFLFSQKTARIAKTIPEKGRDRRWGSGSMALVGGENTRAAPAQGLNHSPSDCKWIMEEVNVPFWEKESS